MNILVPMLTAARILIAVGIMVTSLVFVVIGLKEVVAVALVLLIKDSIQEVVTILVIQNAILHILVKHILVIQANAGVIRRANVNLTVNHVPLTLTVAQTIVVAVSV